MFYDIENLLSSQHIENGCILQYRITIESPRLIYIGKFAHRGTGHPKRLR